MVILKNGKKFAFYCQKILSKLCLKKFLKIKLLEPLRSLVGANLKMR